MKKVGWALGGGAMRGLAHLGVLQVLQENEIPIDFIAGTSIGAVIGGIYVCGTDLKMLLRLASEMNEKDYLDYALPKQGLIKGNRFQELIQLLTKNYTFEQIKIPFASVATNLMDGEKVVIQTGLLSHAIRASMSVPLVFEPVQWSDDMLLVDGSAVERVPIRTARDMGADVVIGVDVGYRGGPVQEKMPTTALGYAIMSADIMGWSMSKLQEKEADLMILPNVYSLSATSFSNSEEIIDCGKKAAEEALPAIKKLLEEAK